MTNKNKNKNAIRLATAALLTVATQAAFAVPVTIDNFAVFRADRTANPIGFSTTALNVQVRVTPSTDPATHVFVTNSVAPATQYEINRVAAGVFAGQHIDEIPYDPSLTGFWTATATNGADTSTPAFRQAFLPIEAMPFVETISFTGTGNDDITIHWTVGAAGAARLDDQQVSIWDITNPLAPVATQFFSLQDVTVRQVTLADLVIGRTYAVEILNTDRRNLANGGLGATDAFSGTWLSGWMPTEGEVFVPVPEPASIVLILTGLAGLGFARRKRLQG